MELHQDLADHAYTRLRAFTLKGQIVEIVDDLLYGLLEATSLLAFVDLRLATRHPMIEQAVRCARLTFIGTRAIEALHEQIAVEDGIDGVIEHRRGDVEARILLIELLERQRDDRNMLETNRFQRFSDERDIVGRAATATRLRDDDRKFVGVVLA